MALPRKNLTIQDEDGNIVDGASIQFRDEATLTLPQAYSDRDGTVAIGNPYVAADGRDAGCFITSGEYRITAILGALEVEWRYEPVGVFDDTLVGDDTIEEFTGSTGTISSGTGNAIVNRFAPATTGLTLPDASVRNGKELRVADYSQSVTAHVITLTPHQASQKIMRQSTWRLNSSGSPGDSPPFQNLASVTLFPVVDPDDGSNWVWVIAP